MYQLIKEIMKHENDSTELFLLFANQVGMFFGPVVRQFFSEFSNYFNALIFLKTETDILLRNELDSLAAKYPDRFHLHYTVDRANPGIFIIKFIFKISC